MTAELSGADLARQALVAAREAVKGNRATSTKPKRRTTTVVRRDGREPLGLGSAISRMMLERGMVAPDAGGSVLAPTSTLALRAGHRSALRKLLRPHHTKPEQSAGAGFSCLSDGWELASSGDWASNNPVFAISRGPPSTRSLTTAPGHWFSDMLLSPSPFGSR